MNHHLHIMRLSALLLATMHLVGCATAQSNSGGGNGIQPPTETWIRTEGRAPTIVFQSGFSDGKAVWADVMEELNSGNAVFAYDRPGYGKNPPSATPRDPCTIASELHAQLQTAGIQPPYVLVGHSLGGLYQYVFAKLYPTDVAGLILLDPTHPRHWETMQREVPASASLISAMRTVAFSSTERREFDAQSACLETLNTTQQPDVPTRLLVSERFKPIEKGDFLTMVKRLRLDWLRLVKAPRLEAIHDAGHYIQRDAPEEVAAAIQSVIKNQPADAAPSRSGKSRQPPPGIISGQTNQDEIRQHYGTPGEQFKEGNADIWIYNKQLKIPTLVSLIPLIGDIADAVELLWNIPNNEELIVQFDAEGIVKKASLRKLD